MEKSSNMISILGGDLQSSLGNASKRLKHLRDGSAHIETKRVEIFSEKHTYPYYAFDAQYKLKTHADPIPQLLLMIRKLIARLNITEEQLSRCGLFLGCSSNDLSLAHPLWLAHSDTYKFENKRLGNGNFAAKIQSALKLHSVSLTYNTACTSSANACIDAAMMLEAKVIDYALVVGMEMFADISFEGFTSMQLLSKSEVRPFSQDREGMVLGESLSAVFFTNQSEVETAWQFCGGDTACEIDSITGAKSDGSGIAKVIQQALKKSGKLASEITAIKAHGTASLSGDIAELAAIKSAFSLVPPFFSFKPYIGHTLGSCGVSELVLMMQVIDNGFLPATLNAQNSIDEFTAPSTRLTDCTSGTFLLNYFGFGGNNCALILKKEG